MPISFYIQKLRLLIKIYEWNKLQIINKVCLKKKTNFTIQVIQENLSKRKHYF